MIRVKVFVFRCRVGDPPVLRRSLRILTKQKLQEEQQLATSITGKPGNSSNSSTENLTDKGLSKSVSKDKDLVDKPTFKRGRKGGEASDKESILKKQKQTSPPPPASKKQAKKSPVGRSRNRKSSKETQDLPADSASSRGRGREAASSTSDRGREVAQSKRKQSKEEISHKGCEERDSVIVVSRKGKSQNAESGTARHTAAERSDSESELASVRKARAKGRGKGRSKAEEGRVFIPKGKGRSGGWNSSNSFSFPRFGMASPE